MQSEVSTAGADQGLARMVEQLKRELAEAHRREAATTDVLKVIRRSPNELQPVLDTVLQTAARLCEAELALFFKLQDETYHLVGSNNAEAAHVKYLSEHPINVDRGSLVGRTALERHTVHLPDCLADPEYTRRDEQRVGKYRSMLGVPLLRDGVPIGVIGLQRTVVEPFTAKQIELVETFADQAVIAIENTRLFEAEQASKRELQELLGYQTATSNVLDLISRSKFDLQPVLDALVQAAAQLCEADIANVWRPRGESYYLAASFGVPSQEQEWLAYRKYLAAITYVPDRRSVVGRTLLAGRTIHIEDVLTDAEYDQRGALVGVRTMLGVPLLRDGAPIGVIVLVRSTVRPFNDKQIALIETFADQAVIAIENTRLFEEVQARNRELAETGEILRVISSSPTDTQPVFDTIVRSAVNLCDGVFSAVALFDGELLHLAAHHNYTPEGARLAQQMYPRRPDRQQMLGRAVLEGIPVQVEDALADREYAQDLARAGTWRGLLGVPMLRDGKAIGAICVMRAQPGPFSPTQVKLLQTFADQAVIAIENTRLFEEVQARNRDLRIALEQQMATSDVLKVISRSTFDLQTVLKTLVHSASSLCQAENVQIFLRDGEVYRLEADNGFSPEYQEYVRHNPIAPGRGTLVARTALTAAAVHMPDVLVDPEYTWREGQRLGRFRAMLGVPLLRDGTCIGVMAMTRPIPEPFTPKQIEIVTTFADQAVIAIENTRLFDEIAQKSRELEIASQHKSQFVANMSHELRTPLAAILGYAELMQEGFYGTPSEKSMDALTRIRSNGKHLLGLINTVLDIAKIEAGQFSLNLARIRPRQHGRDGARGNRVAGGNQEACAQDRRRQAPACRPG